LLIVVAGLPASGKTTIARLAARELGAMHLRIDTIERVRAVGPRSARARHRHGVGAGVCGEAPFDRRGHCLVGQPHLSV
jgi:predicted kinase